MLYAFISYSQYRYTENIIVKLIIDLLSNFSKKNLNLIDWR